MNDSSLSNPARIRTFRTIGTLAVAALVLTGCATTTSNMNSSWVDPDHTKVPIRKVLVIGLARDEAMRKTFESKMANILEHEGVAAVPSFDIMQELVTAPDAATAKEIVRAAVAKCGADAVTVTRLVREDSTERVVQGAAYAAPSPYYYDMYGYYANSYQVVSAAEYVVEDKFYIVESNLYDVATEKLVWTGISETVNPASAAKAVESVGKAIVSTLRLEGLIAR